MYIYIYIFLTVLNLKKFHPNSRNSDTVRQLVGGRHGRPERHQHALVAVVEAALVEDHQQRVEDGRVGLGRRVKCGE